MINRYRVSIGGTQLDQYLENDKRFKDKIVLLNIGYSEPGISRSIETAGDNDGGIITRAFRRSASVTVTFGIYVYNTADRYEACEKIKTLCAKGGTIITNDRPGKALYNCVCEQYPEIDSARDWTAPLTMVFSAYAFPYWQNTAETTKSLTSKKTSAIMAVPGNAPNANVIAEVTAKAQFVPSGTIYDSSTPLLTLGIGSTKLMFNYNMKQNNYLLIDLDSNNNLRARVYETKSSMKLIGSVLGNIIPSSSDKLLATPGENNTVSIEAVKEVAVTFRVRGAWL